MDGENFVFHHNGTFGDLFIAKMNNQHSSSTAEVMHLTYIHT